MVSRYHFVHAYYRLASCLGCNNRGSPQQYKKWQDKLLKYICDYTGLNTKKLSSSLTELILKILNPAEQRISLKDIITHPWMSIKLSDKKLNINFEKIRNYSKFSKVKSFIFSSRS